MKVTTNSPPRMLKNFLNKGIEDIMTNAHKKHRNMFLHINKSGVLEQTSLLQCVTQSKENMLLHSQKAATLG